MEHNLALEIIDDIGEELGVDSTNFTITNDDRAEWALRKKSTYKAEANRFISACENQMAFYQQQIDKRISQLDKETAFLDQMLYEYFAKVPHKVKKTQETYQLPSAVLKLKFQDPEFKRDDARLVDWLKEHEMSEFIKIKESAAWSELKKSVAIDGESVIFTPTGEIIEGIKATERPDIFTVEIKEI